MAKGEQIYSPKLTPPPQHLYSKPLYQLLFKMYAYLYFKYDELIPLNTLITLLSLISYELKICSENTIHLILACMEDKKCYNSGVNLALIT